MNSGIRLGLAATVVTLAIAGRVTVIDALLLFGPLVVVPLGLALLDRLPGGGGSRFDLGLTLAAAALVAAFAMPAGLAAASLTLPWLVVTTFLAADAVRDAGWEWPGTVGLLSVIAVSWLPLAAAHIVLSRSGLSYAGIARPLVELAGVHFTFAGFGATTLAVCLLPSLRGRRRRVGEVTGWGLVAGSAIVAIGHVTADPVELVGTILVAVSVYGLALLGWGALPSGQVSRFILRLSAVAVFAPMLFALAYSWALSTDSAHLSYETIAAVHGSLNAFGFVGCGLLAWWIDRHRIGHAEEAAWLGTEALTLSAVAGGICGMLSLGLWSLVLFMFAFPIGAVVGLGVGVLVDAGLRSWVELSAELPQASPGFVRRLSVLGLALAVLVSSPVLVVGLGEFRTVGSPVLLVTSIGAPVAVALIGWVAGRQLGTNHLRRLATRGRTILPGPDDLVAVVWSGAPALGRRP
jgi:YndJ-like protein